MKALTFSISFFSAHFKVHKAKRFRDTYLIPLPSTISGIVATLFGVERDNFLDWVKEARLYCGAKLVSYGGIATEYSILWKFDNFANLTRTPDIVKFLIEPKYVFAVAGVDSVIDELKQRISELRFEASIYGGSDYHFLKNIGDVREGRLTKGFVGEGYLPKRLLKSLEPINGGLETYFSYVRGNVREDFVFVYRGSIESKEEVDIVDDGENKIFVYSADAFISI